MANYMNAGTFALIGLGIMLVFSLVFYPVCLRLFGIVIIPEDSVGVVNKKFVLMGENKTLPDGAIIALRGEAGYQADTLAPGLHFGFWPWQYDVNVIHFVAVPPGQIGVVEARDGAALSAGRNLGRTVECDSFQSARAFLTKGGQRGPQIAIIPPGVYRINTALFKVSMVGVTEVSDTQVGIVTVKDGEPLPTGEIAGREIAGHNSYQDPETFITNGGFKGLQEQVLLAGRYFINPNFATVEYSPMTEVPIAKVGVVISYVGDVGVDVTGASFKHGNLVERGQKGVCVEPLDPGKYAINPLTHKVEEVPTANVVLNWATGKTESHKLDSNLSTIVVRTSDGYKSNLDVSQIIHIPRTEASKVIARFGSVLNLVTQVLEPIIGSYFRNAAQGSDAIQFLLKRAERQAEAAIAIRAALAVYNVEAVDTLIGDIVLPPELMKTLTDRKFAEQEKITFATQQMAEESRRELEQAKAIANTQAKVVDSERMVAISEYQAQASVKMAEGQAKAKTLNAEADAQVTRLTGDADAAKIEAVGTAQAKVVKLKIDSMTSDGYTAIEVSRNLSKSTVPIVPTIVAGGGERNGLMDVVLGTMIKDNLKGNVHESE